MKIKSIELSWFRGAAEPVTLPLECKSMVVYGANGSGKSSFVDAVEYILNGGRIEHLAHEYSGKRQEKAIPNTHTPQDQRTRIRVEFADKSESRTLINRDGSAATTDVESVAMHTWDYRRVVLRQDEVASFICDTKGDKYSALLPLLGLHQLDVAAENLRQLAKAVEERSKLREIRAILSLAARTRRETFGTITEEQIAVMLYTLHDRYCQERPASSDALCRCANLKAAIDARISASTAEQRLYVTLQDVAALGLKSHVDAVRATSVSLADAIEPLIAEKLEVLLATGTFAQRLGDQGEVECPACGRLIPVHTFKEHVESEEKRLHLIIGSFNCRKSAILALSDAVKMLQSLLGRADVKLWRNEHAAGTLADNLSYLDGIDIAALRLSCGEDALGSIEAMLLPLLDVASSACKDAPPDAKQLSEDRRLADAGEAVFASLEKAAEAARAESLLSTVKSLEQGIRDEIRLRAESVIGEISDDIRSMWDILNPDKAIQDIRLYLPKDVDKAIDVGLKFHTIEQESPRLTLSEGYRNALGLCIFLAMAKREADRDRPVFLDDVVISFDRNHRGMVAELLQKQFDKRQVVVLTHDREWYTELRQILEGEAWIFKALLPYETPELGIRWSDKSSTFADARSQLKERPDAAGNDARKIMDVELSLISQRLRLELPFLRGDKNDSRLAHEFLERLIADGKKCFKVKTCDAFTCHTTALDSLVLADRLLLAWANRASHTFDLVHPEAVHLIDVCEKALESFRCSSCGKRVWFAEAEGAEWVQCQCGQIRWQYGKA